ncbi:MAG: hypothetical protein V2I36_19160, partial [Desulfopila sp.]|nr:hypothetical protein [Desulfopila sp.]
TTLTCILQGSRYLASQGDLRKAIVGVCIPHKPRRIAGHIEPHRRMKNLLLAISIKEYGWKPYRLLEYIFLIA